MIKANAYGHGIARVARSLEDADGFAVARIEEALRLRELGIGKPLLILEGVFSVNDVRAAIQAGCQLTIHHPFQIELLESLDLPSPVVVWLKVDTGMHRLGIRVAQLPEMTARLQRLSGGQRVEPDDPSGQRG